MGKRMYLLLVADPATEMPITIAADAFLEEG